MNNEQHARCSEIQTEVLGYLNEHPTATDSIEGIRQWWVMQRLAEYSLGRVQEAVDELESARLIERHTLADGRMVYAKADCSDRQAL